MIDVMCICGWSLLAGKIERLRGFSVSQRIMTFTSSRCTVLGGESRIFRFDWPLAPCASCNTSMSENWGTSSSSPRNLRYKITKADNCLRLNQVLEHFGSCALRWAQIQNFLTGRSILDARVPVLHGAISNR